MRWISFASTVASGRIAERAPATPVNRVAAGAATDSTSVFQAPQCGHCPCHLGDWPPHSVQLWTVFDLAIARAARLAGQLSSVGRTTEAPSLPTTTPAASLAMRTASASGAPAATSVPSVAITVSPAPETS